MNHFVHQTTFGGPDDAPEERGDCYSACLAAVLGLPLSDVPRFCELDPPWEPHVNEWLGRLGAYTFTFAWGEHAEHVLRAVRPLVILTGGSPRNDDRRHAVVAEGDAVVHDPYPGWRGPAILPHEEGHEIRSWEVDLIAPLDPARLVFRG